MKTVYYLAFLVIIFSPQAQSSSHSPGNSELIHFTDSLINDADRFLSRVENLPSSAPLYPHKEELIELIVAQKAAAERVKEHIGNDGLLVCYDGSTEDIQIITDSGKRITEIQKNLPQTHTGAGHVASYVLGTKAVQKIGGFMGYCYKGGIAVSNN